MTLNPNIAAQLPGAVPLPAPVVPVPVPTSIVEPPVTELLPPLPVQAIPTVPAT